MSRNDFSDLPVLHHLASGIKSYCMELQYYGQDEMRQACGGAGFLLSSGVALQWLDTSPGATFEGTQTVMYQQAVRYAYQQLKMLEQDSVLTGFLNYLNDKDLLLKSKCSAKTIDEFVSFNNLSHTLAARAAAIISATHKLYKSSD